MSTRARSHRLHRLLRRLALLSGLAAVGGVVAVLWLLHDAYRDRSEELYERVGDVARVQRSPVETGGDYVGEAVRIESTTGLGVDLRLLRPRGDGLARPAAIILGGHRTGRDAVELIGDPGDIVVAALDYPLEGSDRIKGLLPVLGALPRIRAALLDTAPAVALAARWLATEPAVDPARIELVGVSLGGAFAPVAAALEPTIARLWLVHGGAVNHREWLDHALRSKVGSPPLRRATSLAAFVLARGPALRPRDWLDRLPPRDLVLISARHDERLPSPLVEELIAAAPGPLRVVWTEGGHVDTDDPELVRELIATVLDGMGGELPPLVRRTPATAAR